MSKTVLAIEDIPLFLAFAQCKNTSLAAERLGLSQPAFNERLRRMEAHLRPSPFAWKGNKRILSDFGKTLLSTVAPQIQTLQLLIDDKTQGESSHRGRPLRVAGRNEIFSRLSGHLANFSHQLIIQNCSSRESLERVQSGEVDLAISVVKPEDPLLVIRKLFFSHAVVAVPKKFLKGKKILDMEKRDSHSISLDAIKTLPWFAYQEQDKLFLSFLNLAGWKSSDINLRMCCDDWKTLWQFVMAGEGCAVFPSAYAQSTNAVFVYSPAPNFQKNPFYMVCRRERSAWPQVREFYEVAKQVLENRLEFVNDLPNLPDFDLHGT